jgi:general nucleoside transport system permease protein
LYLFKDPEIQGPETITVGAGYHLPLLHDLSRLVGLEWFKSTPVSFALFVALGCAVLCYLFLFYTTAGYEMRAVGHNPVAARFAGISVSRNTVLSFFLSGAMAGLVGVNEVMGYQHKVVEGFSPGYGFTGIAVALLARNHPIGLIFSALLFGALQNSARELEFESEKVTKELSLVLQGTLIAFVASHYLIEGWLKRWTPKRWRPEGQSEEPTHA